ncbi:MAG: ATP synthase F1 subunit delta [Bacteroidia bacterium]
MIVATRYAKSLLDLAVEKGQLEAVYQDMLLVQQVSENNHDFVIMLESPIIKTDKKQSILHEIFKGKITDMSMSFIDIITDKRREMYVDDIAKSFVEQYKAQKRILTAVITSAAGIDDATRKKVMDLVKQTSQGEVELIEKVDKKLIGGFVLRIGDKQVDASIARKLNDLRKNFSENPYVAG